MTHADRAALAAAVARLLALIDAGDLDATDTQQAWLRGYLAALIGPLAEPGSAQ